MPLPLLQTKLYTPTPRPQLVARPAVIAKLGKGAAYPLTLVAAPAGFGKTTLISEWISQTDQPVAWLSLDDDDNDLSRFLIYLVAALRNVHPHIGESTLAILHAPQLPAVTSLLTPLLNDLSQFADPLALVLDDYHLITAEPIHEALTFLIEHLPPPLRLIITTRIDPPLPLARWRVRGQLVEIRAADLRFGIVETTAFFHQILGLSLSSVEIATLEARTEGWIAALQLVALSMQGRQNTAEFVAAFTGSNRFIVDYLAEEVWQRLPADTQQFLMQTAPFERFCADLSAVVTGQTNAQAVLSELDQANLFLVALDDERKWYRYHHLFQDLLQQRLRTQADTTAINELHQRAAHWFQEQSLTDEAIRHYLAGAATDQAAALIERVGFERIGQGYLVRLRHWLDLLPLGLVRSRPWLALYRAWILNLAGQSAALALWLQEANLTPQVAPTDLSEDMQAQIITLHTYQMRRQGQIDLAIASLQQVLKLGAAGNALTRSTANINLGYNYWLTGQLTLADQFLQMAQIDAQTIQAVHAALMAKSTQAIVAVAQGRLRRAVQLCEETIREGLAYTGGQPFASAGYAYAVLGNIWVEQNQWEKAESALNQAMELGELVIDGTIVRRAIFGLAFLKQMAGDAVAAQTLWQRAFAAADTVEEPYVRLQQVRTWLVQASLQSDQAALAQASQWAAAYSSPPIDQSTYITAYAQMLCGWLDLLHGQADRAIKRLAPLIEAARSAGHTQHLIQLLAVQALAHAATGDTALAHTQLHQLLHLTAPEGYIRIYVDAGEPMRALLSDLRAQSSPAPGDHKLALYLDTLLDASNVLTHTAVTDSASTHLEDEIVNRKSSIQNLIEPLTERELEILRLVAAGLSNSQLADQIIVTVGTIKKHLNNIYGKLGVASRTQAIARGRELGLLND